MVLLLIVGLLGLFSGVVITTLVYLNILYFFYGLIIITAIGILESIVLLLYTLMSGGVLETLTSARLRGNPLALILRNDKAIRFVEARLREGLADTKRYGKFIIVPDSVYALPNGVTTFIAYHKYGVSLNPKFVQAVTHLRKAGITDIEQVRELNAQAKTNHKEYTINLDKDILEARNDGR